MVFSLLLLPPVISEHLADVASLPYRLSHGSRLLKLYLVHVEMRRKRDSASSVNALVEDVSWIGLVEFVI